MWILYPNKLHNIKETSLMFFTGWYFLSFLGEPWKKLWLAVPTPGQPGEGEQLESSLQLKNIREDYLHFRTPMQELVSTQKEKSFVAHH